MSNFINDYLNQYFDEVTPFEFYRSIFPEGELEEQGNQQHGKYNAIAVEVLPEANKKTNRQNVHRYLVHDGLEKLPELLESENFIIMSPISYAGMSRKSENARYIYALAFDLDGITKEQHLIDLFHQIDTVEHLPKPTYIVSSGSGLHLYYQFEKPIPCFDNINKQMARLKKSLTSRLWNMYTTSLSKNVQYESVFQGFRLVGGVTKSGSRTRAFATGDKVTIEYLNSFVWDEKDKVTEYTYKSKLTLSEAQKKYPEWYDRRIVQKQARSGWTCKRDLFEWWLKTLKEKAKAGHRYYCVMCLAVYAKKCGIECEELEEIAFDLVEELDKLTKEDNNHFTRADVLAALEMYNDNYIRFPIHSISELTAIPIEKNKRNGMKQALHLEIARSTKHIKVKAGICKNGGGNPSKEDIVVTWRSEHPDGSKKECMEATNLGKSTVYKYWNK